MEKIMMYSVTAVSELVCDECFKHIGWVYECDLNGSSFFCDGCAETKRKVDIFENQI